MPRRFQYLSSEESVAKGERLRKGGDKPAPKDLSHHVDAVDVDLSDERSLRRFEHVSKEVYECLNWKGLLPRRLTRESTSRSVLQSISKSPTASQSIVPSQFQEAAVNRRDEANGSLSEKTNFVRRFIQNNLHVNCPYNTPNVLLTSSSVESFSKVMQLLYGPSMTNPPMGNTEGKSDYSKQESILVLADSYIDPPNSCPIKFVSVPLDSQGLRPSGRNSLEDTLSTWNLNKGPRPKLLYLNSIPQQPSTKVLNTERRKMIYSVCRTYDVLIIEDEPYWYLQYPSSFPKGIEEARAGLWSDWESSGFELIDSLVPSFVSLDLDGRVLRMDSLPSTPFGCGLHWITAQPALIEKLRTLKDPTSSNLSNLSVQDLNTTDPPATPRWDTNILIRWLQTQRTQHEQRLHTLTSILTQNQTAHTTSQTEADWLHVEPTRLFEFNVPEAGVFLYLTLNLRLHPCPDTDTSHLLATLVEYLPKQSSIFYGDGAFAEIQCDATTDFEMLGVVRLCFSGVDEDTMEQDTNELVRVLKDFFAMASREEINEITSHQVSGVWVEHSDSVA